MGNETDHVRPGDGRQPAEAGEPTAREAGWLLLFDRHDRVFLLRGSDPARPGITWWLTPGGGLHDGESPRDGALRETAEETGWSAQAGAHACLRRDVEFTFMAKRYRQREVFYPARVGGAEDLDRSRWTMEECQSLLEGRWWTVQELRDTGDTIYPEQLADLAESLIREGWE